MSYALGAVSKPRTIRIGEGAKIDPILSRATLFGSAVLNEVSSLPPKERLMALRDKLNALYPDMGNRAISKMRELQRKGHPANQAAFDGVRLAIADRLVEYTLGQMRSGGVSGLGDTTSDVSAAIQGFCAFGIGTATTAVGMAAAFSNPTASTGVVSAAQAGASIAGCGQQQLQTQAQIAEAQARAAEANAAAASAAAMIGAQQQQQASGNTLLYVGIGAGVLAVLGVGYAIVRKK
jgi:hypothetical protein